MNYKKMALLNTLGNIIYLFALWVLTVIITRTIGFVGAGIFSLAMSIGNMFHTFQMYGMRSYQVSDVAGEYTSGQYFSARYVSTALGFLLCGVYCGLSGYTIDKIAVILSYTLFRACEAVSDAYFGELQKVGRLDILAKSMIAKSILMIIIFTGILAFTKNLTLALLGIVAMAALITICYDRRACKRILGNVSERITASNVRGPLRSCFLLMVSNLIPIVVTALPRILLDKYGGEELLGYYGNVSTPTVLITAIIPNILFPVMTWYGKLILQKAWKSLLKGLMISLVACGIFGVLACIAVWLLGDFVMALIFTEKIVPYVPYMYPLIIATVIYAMTMCANSILISLRKNKMVTVCSAVSLAAAGICSVPLVKNYSIMGAILVLGIAYFVQFVFQLAGIVTFFRKKDFSSI